MNFFQNPGHFWSFPGQSRSPKNPEIPGKKRANGHPKYLFYLQQDLKLKNQSFKDMKLLVIFGHEFFSTDLTPNSVDSDVNEFGGQIKVIYRFSAYQTDIEVKNSNASVSHQFTFEVLLHT